MTDQEFDFIRKVLQERAAIVLEPGKQYLVESRLTPLVRQLNLGSIGELVACLRAEPDRSEDPQPHRSPGSDQPGPDDPGGADD